MNRDTRDKFTASTDQDDLLYGESACLETPPDLFAALHEEFDFQVDLCAHEKNKLLPVWFGPGSQVALDCLTTPWGMPANAFSPFARQRGFGNPAYGKFIAQYMEKARNEAEHGFLSVHLLPLRVTAWFKRIILPYAEIRFVDTRIKFWYNGVPKLQLNAKTQKMEHMPALFDSIVVVFRSRVAGRLYFPKPPVVWHWDKQRKIR